MCVMIKCYNKNHRRRMCGTMKSNNKLERILDLYTKLLDGYVINKAKEAIDYGVNERTIQRDIDEIRNFLETRDAHTSFVNTIVYDRILKGYKMEQMFQTKFTNSEVLAISKILLDSRAFRKDEMVELLHKLIECCVPQSNKDLINSLIRNEEFHYVAPLHNKKFIDTMWNIASAIHSSHYIEIKYLRTKDKAMVKRKLKPLAILFSEYYFYLTAFIEDENMKQNFHIVNDSFPTIYRIDRIVSLKVLQEKFNIPYASRFEEGEFRKRIQFMQGGKLEKITFKYKGISLEAVLDRIPTAKVLGEENGSYIISAEVFGNGIDMWLRSQGENIELISRK